MSTLRRALHRSAAASLLAALCACSGGGGGSGGGSGGGGGSGTGLTLGRTSVAFSGAEGSSVPGQSVAIQVTDPSITQVAAGYPPGVAEASWLTVGIGGTASAPVLTLSIWYYGVVAGEYKTTVRFAGLRADGSVVAWRDLSVTYTAMPVFTAYPATAAFSGLVTGTIGPKQVSVGGTAGLSWTATSTAPWVTLTRTSGTTPSTVGLGVDTAGLAAGSYSATVTFTAGSLTDTVDLTLTLGAAALQASTARLSFSAVNGAPIAAKPVSLSVNSGAAVAWTATPGAPWMILDRTSGSTPDTISVRVDPSIGPLASGSYSAPLTIEAEVPGETLTATVTVDLALTRPTLSVAPTSLVLGGADGRDPTSRPVQVALNTGTSAYAWTAVPSDAWAVMSATSGNASATAATVDVVGNPTGLRGGTRTGTIAFSAAVNGDKLAVSLPVTYNLEAHRIAVAPAGVGLASVSGRATLTRTVRVTDTLGGAAPWTATSDQAWLEVTPLGTADSDVVLTAEPTGLQQDQLHLATVTIASSDPTVENVETVRVGLWVGSTAPSAAVQVAGTFAEVVADPIRPYVYAHSGGTAISVYDAYTGASVATIPGDGGLLAGMAIAGDGSTLWVGDRTGGMVFPVDLDTRTAGTAWALAAPAPSYPRLAWARPGGVPVVIATDRALHAAADGHVVATYASSYDLDPWNVGASARGNVACSIRACKSLAWSALGGGTLRVGSLQSSLGDYDGALAADGSIVYRGWGGYVPAVSMATGVEVAQLGLANGIPGFMNVEMGPDGRIYAGASQTPYQGDDVWVFAPGGAQVGTLRAGVYPNWLRVRTLVVSGDGLRLAVVMGDAGTPGPLRIVAIPAW